MEYLSLILFCISTCVTPGPNNTMIMASGVNHGFRKSLPHMLGINVGFPLMLVIVGLGAGNVFQQVPLLQTVLKAAGAAYLSYMAYKIATTPAGQLEAGNAKPFSFIQAALFQWVNPKAWIMAVGAVVTYSAAGGNYFLGVLQIGLIFFLFGAPCTGIWLWFGAALRDVLSTPPYRRVFNSAMALLLLSSLIPVFRDLYASYAA